MCLGSERCHVSGRCRRPHSLHDNARIRDIVPGKVVHEVIPSHLGKALDHLPVYSRDRDGPKPGMPADLGDPRISRLKPGRLVRYYFRLGIDGGDQGCWLDGFSEAGIHAGV